MDDAPVLGIDLGTTNSVVAVADGGQARVLSDEMGRRLVPSVVSFHPNGRTLVGYEARDRRLVDAANTVYAVKRLIGRPFDSPEVQQAKSRFAFELVADERGGCAVNVRSGTYTLPEISARVLGEIRRIAELQLERTCERAVVTVPANFNELQRSATKAAAKIAGLEVLRIVNEPTAAALAYGISNQTPGHRVAVYDLGGGTFDITILELDNDVFEVLSTAGESFLGGEDVDSVVADRMADAFLHDHGVDLRAHDQNFERVKAAAEWVKCRLSRKSDVELTVEELAHGKGGQPLDLAFAMDKEELNTLVRPLIERSLVVCESALHSAGLKRDEIDSVLLVGGSTRMPIVRDVVEDYFGRPPRTELDPDMVVAQGVAIHGYALAGATQTPLRALGKMKLKRISAAEYERRQREKAALPTQPAFNPEEELEAAAPRTNPPRATNPPPPLPDLPPPSAPPALLHSTDDPFAAPTAGGAHEGNLLSQSQEAGLDDPFAELDPVLSIAPEELESLPPSDVPAAPPLPNLAPALPIIAAGEPAALPAPPAAPPPPPNFDALPSPRGREPTKPFAVAAPPIAAQPVIAIPDAPAPLLMDVTPHSLGIETAGGFCRRLVVKNAPVPTEQQRAFSTAADGQTSVEIRISQGEEERFEENEILGSVVLDNLPDRARGQVHIEVTFIVGADGTLRVEARDAETGHAQEIRIDLRGGMDDSEIEALRARQQREMA